MIQDAKRVLKRKRRRGRRREPPRDLSRAELVEYLREHGFRTRDQLRAGRKPGDPSSFDYEAEFGSWSNAVDVVFGAEIITTIDADYIVKAVRQFRLWTRDAWREAHRASPSTIPSTVAVNRIFGSWSVLKICAERVDTFKMLESYGRLMRKLGRTPTIMEAEHDGVPVRELVIRIGSKKLLAEIVSGIERQREKRIGSPSAD